MESLGNRGRMAGVVAALAALFMAYGDVLAGGVAPVQPTAPNTTQGAAIRYSTIRLRPAPRRAKDAVDFLCALHLDGSKLRATGGTISVRVPEEQRKFWEGVFGSHPGLLVDRATKRRPEPPPAGTVKGSVRIPEPASILKHEDRNGTIELPPAVKDAMKDAHARLSAHLMAYYSTRGKATLSSLAPQHVRLYVSGMRSEIVDQGRLWEELTITIVFFAVEGKLRFHLSVSAGEASGGGNTPPPLAKYSSMSDGHQKDLTRYADELKERTADVLSGGWKT
ncbi:hypothetical protein ACFL09_02855 [Planctomycetota bacterium]